MKRTNRFIGLLIFAFLCLESSHGFSQSSGITQGSIDLRQYDFKNQEPVSLRGDWKFFWKQLVTPSQVDSSGNFKFRSFTELWNSDETLHNKGYATYSLKVKLPAETPPLALRIPDFYSSYVLYLNGSEIANNGQVGETKEEYTPHWLPQTVILPETDSDTLHLVLHVANFHHSKGGAYRTIKIGEAAKLIDRQSVGYGYSFLLTGALLMGGLFFFGLYLFGKHQTTILYFSLFCIVYSYRIIGFGSYPLHFLLPDLPWIITTKLEYITLFLSGHLFGMYTLTLYPRETSKKLVYLLSGISLLFLAIALLLPASIFTHLVIPYFLILVIYILYAFWVYVQAAINRNLGARFALASTGVVFVVFLYEILLYFGIFERFLLLNFLGYLFFFFLQALILSFRFAKSLELSKEKAEESSRAKSQFLSTMSHEIRTPLNAVIGLSGLLSESDLNKKQKEYANTIKKSGESLLGILNNILDYSKIESGKLELDNIEFNLRELVETVLELVASLNEKPGLELVYKMEENVPEFIICDSTRLQQVLINLITNAFKFTEKGEILVRISAKEITKEKANLLFEISDTGIGIPEDKMHKLFQSFSQVDASSTRRYGGTGLGLVISKKLVKALGGKISVSSKIDEGSTFRFNVQAKPSKVKQDKNVPNVLKGRKVFILDDNATNREILEQQLKKSGLEVKSYSDPMKLVGSLYKDNTFDFGILDMQMPDMDGIEVAEQIRKKWAKEEFPLVLLSSIHQLEDPNQKNLFNLYLTKPVKQSLLLYNLERIYSSDLQKYDSTKSSDIPLSEIRKELNILVVEDNLINQKVAQQILGNIGYEIEIAANGEVALEMTNTNEYDLVFMDMEMPIMDGLDATRAIRRDNKQETDLIIIAMTANALPGDRERCIDAGMDDFMTKPITLQSVKAVIDKWFYN